MIALTTDAVVLSATAHGETGVVARLLTPDEGLRAGFVHGGRGRTLRPLLQPATMVSAMFRARTESTLPTLALEALRPSPALGAPRMTAAALAWGCALLAAVLPDGDPHPAVYAALTAWMARADTGDGTWAAASLARFELLLLAELGFGLDLSTCAATGTNDTLTYVSPRSSRAVSAAAGEPYAAKLLPLPVLLLDPQAPATAAEALAALTTTGHFVDRDLISPARRAALWPSRERLLDLLAR